MGKKDKAAATEAAPKEAKEAAPKEEVSYESKIKFCCVIAKPLADEKMCKRVLKLAKKASGEEPLLPVAHFTFTHDTVSLMNGLIITLTLRQSTFTGIQAEGHSEGREGGGQGAKEERKGVRGCMPYSLASSLAVTPVGGEPEPIFLSHACAYIRRICILAGDISPVDVLTHIPIICEDHHIPYIYVPSKEVGKLLETAKLKLRLLCHAPQ